MSNMGIYAPRTIRDQSTDCLAAKYALTSFTIRLSKAYADGLIYANHLSHGRMYGTGITKPVYIVNSVENPAPNGIDSDSVLDFAPSARQIIEPVSSIMKEKRR